MDPVALETLRAVGTHGGVTPAATVLHVTPSAVSQQLARLQREVGVPLTERVGRGLRLTPAGQALAAAAVDVAVALQVVAAHVLGRVLRSGTTPGPPGGRRPEKGLVRRADVRYGPVP